MNLEDQIEQIREERKAQAAEAQRKRRKALMTEALNRVQAPRCIACRQEEVWRFRLCRGCARLIHGI